MAVCAVRKVTSIKCYSPTGQNRERFCREMSQELGIEVKPALSMKEAYDGVDIALNSTSSIEPIFPAELVRRGMHVSSIKAQEIGADALNACDRVVLFGDHNAPQIVTAAGVEYAESGGDKFQEGFDFSECPTLPQVIAGLAPGRQSGDEITCFVNNLGMGYQFAAVGGLVYGKAVEAKVGHELPTEWFTEDVHP
jgi:ornithine cyclodeaminase/alanine dehydrogenase-like protein (mu-crystallin family)